MKKVELPPPSSFPTQAPFPTPLPSLSPTAPPLPSSGMIYLPDVPFTSQAPFGDWSDPRQQDGCEEAAVLIAMSWATNRTLTPSEALSQILAMAAYQENSFGSFVDTSAIDTQERLIRGYFNYPGSQVLTVESPDDIVFALTKNHLVISPTNGQLLHNPNFTAPGPERHNLVIIGYDFETDEFITHDPGTRRGKDYRYPRNVLFNAVRDYPTGNHTPIVSESKTVISVSQDIR